jgi:hypothetical protein
VSPRIGVPVATVWTSPDAARDEDAAAVADHPDVQGWTASMDGTARRGLHGRTLTQALLGEPVDVEEEAGPWLRVRLPWQPHSPAGTGYPGWLRRAHVVDEPGSAAGADVVAVDVPETACLPERGGRIESLSYGTVLPVEGTDADRVVVRLPDGDIGRIAASDVRAPGAPATTADVLASARRHLGLRYLWGGTCGWGLDCSGFVHLVHRVHGVLVPRDASDQNEQADRWPDPVDARPGGLYFFARPGQRAFHVGFATGWAEDAQPARPTMLHAPESGPGDGGLIEDAPMAPHRSETLVSAGRFLPVD